MPTRVSIVEDDSGIRSNLASLLDNTPGFQCLAAYPDAETALREISAAKPDVVLMDINLPGLSGVECVRQLKVQSPDLRVVMLTVYDDEDNVFESLKAGADGYLLKRASWPVLMESLNELLQGGVPMSRQIARCVIQYFRDIKQQPAVVPAKSKSVEEALTDREQDILKKLAEGFHYKEIGSALGISIHTVRNHIRSIYDKLQVHSRTEAMIKYLGATR